MLSKIDPDSKYFGVESHFLKLLTQQGTTIFQNECLIFRQWAIISFFQSFRADKKFFRAPKGTKKILDYEVKLWRCVLGCLERLISLGLWEYPSFKSLASIVDEYSFVLLIFQNLEADATSTNVFKKIQNQNRILMDINNFNPLENPLGDSTTTANFINISACYAYQDPSFCKELYLPMIRARSAFVTMAKNEGFVIFDRDGKPSTQGRKKLHVS